MGAAGVANGLTSLFFDLPGHQSGKVRESWQLPNNRRLLVTTDRLSVLDRVVGLVPHKGQVLNLLAGWWFDNTRDIVPNHALAIPDPMALIAVDAAPLPIEVIVRARLTGSTSTSILPRYLAGERRLYGHELPDGLRPHERLPEPIITPTTKAAAGEHDEAIDVDEVVSSGLLDDDLWNEVQRVALALFRRGESLADTAGFVLADTKYEFGLAPSGDLLLIDEVHTPDSSRFWAKAPLERVLDAGSAPEGFDKEPVRLAYAELGYRGDGEPPALPNGVWEQTSSRYIELYERLTGRLFVPAREPADERLAENLAPWLP